MLALIFSIVTGLAVCPESVFADSMPFDVKLTQVKRITRKTVLFGEGHTHCDLEDCNLQINGSRFSKRTSYILNESGKAERLLWYRPEGPLEYTRDDMRKDKKLAASHEFFAQTVIKKDGFILDGKRKLIVRSVSKNPNVIIVDDPNIVFEYE